MRFPKLDLLAGKIETRRHNADDLRTPPLYPQAFPYDIRFSSETAEPQSMAQYNHAFLAFCFIGGEASSHHRLNAQQRKQIGRDSRPIHSFCVLFEGQIEGLGLAEHSHFFKQSASPLPIFEIRIER